MSPLFAVRNRAVSRSRRRALVLEALEVRCVPTTYTWAADVGGDINNASNWVDPNGNHAVPSGGDAAVIPFADITVTDSTSGTIGFDNLDCAATIAMEPNAEYFQVGGTSTVAGVNVGRGNHFEVVSGTTTLTGQSIIGSNGFLLLDSGAVVDNTGTINFSGDSPSGQLGLQGPATSPATLNNTGTLMKSGLGTTEANAVIVNDLGGKMVVTGGELDLNAGGTSEGGNYTVSAGADLEISGGLDRTISGTFTGSGGGTVSIQTNNHHILVADTGATFDFPPGMLQFKNVLVFPATPGAVPTLTNLGDVTIPNLHNETFQSVVFQNDGTFTANSASLTVAVNAVVHNTGTFTLNGSSTVGGDPTAILTNTGAIVVAAGAGTSINASDPLTNSGSLEVQSGTLMLITSNYDPLTKTLKGGTWRVDNGATLDFSRTPVITANTGTITLNGPNASFGDLSALASNSGSLTLNAGATLTTPGGLANTGTITVGPGSTLTVKGQYSQTAGANLIAQIGGDPASGQFGTLASQGAATLAGDFTVGFANGYLPSAGNSYTMMTYPSATGAFDKIVRTSAGSGQLVGVALNPTDVVVTTNLNASDLAIASADINAPSSATPGQPFTISYTVNNLAAAATGISSWVDSIYVSQSSQFDGSAVLVGRVPHDGAVAGGANYTGSLSNVAFPGVLPGTYHVFVEVDSREQVADPYRTNNVAAAPGTLDVTVPGLTPGTPASGTLASGGDAYYQLNATAGETVSLSATGPVTLEVSYAAIPTDAVRDFASSGVSPSITIPATLNGAYYIHVHATQSGAYTLSAQALGFQALGFTPTSATTAAPFVATINGAGFAPGATASLVDSGGATHAASSVEFQSPTTLFATFDPSTLTAGSYQLQVTNPDASKSTAPGSLTLASGAGAKAGQVAVTVNVPAVIRPEQEGLATIDYTNTGTTDVPAPLIVLSSQDVQFRMPGETNYQGSTLMVLGINPAGPLGVLPPGFHGEFSVPFLPLTAGLHLPYTVTVQLADPTQAFPWSQFANLGQSGGTPSSTSWSSIVSAASTKLGSTWGQVINSVDQALPQPQNSGGPAPSGAALDGDYDFLRLLRYTTFAAGSPASGPAGAGPAVSPASLPAGVSVVATVPKVLTLYQVGGGSGLVAGAPTYLVTPGLGGQAFGGGAGTRYLDLANAIAAAEPNANVLLLDWSPEAPQTFFVGAAGPSANTLVKTDGINPTADALYGVLAGLQAQGLFNPASATFMGETFGNAVNDRVAAEFRGAGLGVVDDAMVFDPPNEISGYDLRDLGANFQYTYTFETCLILDSHLKLGLAHAQIISTSATHGPPALNDAPPPNFTIYEDFSSEKDAEQGVLWLASRLTAGDASWLTPQSSLVNQLAQADNSHWDGSVAFGTNYDPTPVQIHTCFAIDGGGDDQAPDNGDDNGGGGGNSAGGGGTGGGDSGGGGNVNGGGGNNGPSPGTPPGLGGSGGSSGGEQKSPNDPNDITGPAGFGAAGFIPQGQTLPYSISFQNEPTADLAAQVVTITEQLDPNLDWSTFQLGDFGFGSYRVDVPAGVTNYSTRIDARATVGLYVDVQASFDSVTGRASWTFTSIDPTTGDQTTDVLAGFLPPDTSPPAGEGFVSYTVQPKASDATGTTIGASASVVFDTNAPVVTSPITNTIDTGAPTSSVATLASTVGASFPVTWSGTDDTGGSGVASYDVYASDNNGPFTLWQSATTQTSATFNGAYGHSYAFYSVATDNVGHVQPTPGAPQATTQVIATPLRVTSISPSANFLTSLPNNQVVVTFNRALAGLVPNKPDGSGMTSAPFAVMLIPSGPDGQATQKATGVFWSAPTGQDDGDLPIPATAVYAVNADGTSTITMTPHQPLATDIYLISIGGVSDLFGDPLSTDAAGDPGRVYSSFDYRPSTNSSAPSVTGVTADNGTVPINNNAIPQPDTIAIRFSKPMDTYTINTETVQLFENGVNGPLAAAVTYSPTTQSAYLTPETALSPGHTFYVAVNTGVTDDQNFSSNGTPLAAPYYTSFSVTGTGAAGSAGTSPLRVLGTTPTNGMVWPNAFGYAAVTFSEAINLSSLGRFSAMLIPHTGGVTTGTSGYADVPVNAKLAFNPNTNQLILVPTGILPNGTIYAIALSGIAAAKNADTLSGTAYSTFLWNAPVAAPQVASRTSVAAADVVVPTGGATPVAPSGAVNAVVQPVAPATRTLLRPKQAVSASRLNGPDGPLPLIARRAHRANLRAN